MLAGMKYPCSIEHEPMTDRSPTAARPAMPVRVAMVVASNLFIEESVSKKNVSEVTRCAIVELSNRDVNRKSKNFLGAIDTS